MNLLISSGIIGNVLSGVIGAIIAFLGSFLLLRFNYKDLFAKTVSQDRILWLKQMREYAEDLLCYIRNHYEKDQRDESGKNYFDYIDPILLRLNVETTDITSKNTIEQKIFNLLNCDFTEIKTNLYDQSDKGLIYLFRRMLKDEWEKVKCEARGYDSILSYKTKYNKVFLTAIIIKWVVTLATIIFAGAFLDVYIVSEIDLPWLEHFLRGFYMILVLAFLINDIVKTIILSKK